MQENLNTNDVGKIIAQPFYAIEISESLFGSHEPMITKDEWVRCQIKLLKELGEHKYFETLLESLESPVLSPGDEDVATYTVPNK